MDHHPNSNSTKTNSDASNGSGNSFPLQYARRDLEGSRSGGNTPTSSGYKMAEEDEDEFELMMEDDEQEEDESTDQGHDEDMPRAQRLLHHIQEVLSIIDDEDFSEW